jgi:hypothetical protein
MTNDTLSQLLHHPVVATAAGIHVPGGEPTDIGRVTALHVDGDEVWAIAAGRRLLHVAHGEARTVAVLPDGPDATCVVTHRGTVLVGGDEASLWQLDDAELVPVRSFWEAPGRDEWHTPWGGPPSVLSMTSHGDDLYVGVHVGGILRSTDGGATWSPTIDLHDDVHQVVVDHDDVVYAATGMRGLGRSTDHGRTWEYHTDGLHATYLLTAAVTGEGVLVGAGSGHAGRDGAVYRFDGRRFDRVTDLPQRLDGQVMPRCLAAAGDDVVVALPGGDVHVSADAGRTWDLVAEQLDGVTEVALSPR